MTKHACCISAIAMTLALVGCENRPPAPAPVEDSRPAAPIDAAPAAAVEPSTTLDKPTTDDKSQGTPPAAPSTTGAKPPTFGAFPGGVDNRPKQVPSQGGGFIPASLLQVQDAPPAEDDPTGEFKTVTFKQLAGFPYYSFGVPEFEDVDLTETGINRIPDNIQQLDGQKIAVAGFMMPLEIRNGRVRAFLLMRNQASCCFGAPVNMNEWIDVSMADDHWADYTMDRPVTVRGVVRVGETKNEDGLVLSLYRMTDVEYLRIP
ncbi:MAG: DUF3299 domain-containing protein [Phycisphaerales bacterium]|nr:DUF3299 domain-containing protein [Phycisphaerales bacterium]